MTKSKNKPKAKVGSLKPRRPIADLLIKRMRSYVGAKVIDVSAVMAGKRNAEELQKSHKYRVLPFPGGRGAGEVIGWS